MKPALLVAGIIVLCAACVFGGVMLATMKTDVNDESIKTAETLADIRVVTDAAAERERIQHERTVTEIRYIREQVRADVEAMDGDVLADALNHETGLWRVAKSAGRVDSADRGLLRSGERREGLIRERADIPP